MSIPFYFAAEENEAEPEAGKRYAQLGFGFSEDGRLDLPQRAIPDAPAVINDRYLPLKAPDPFVLNRLAEACGNGCFLDFERPVNEVSAAIAVGLQQRLRAKMTVPPAFRRLCPDAAVQITGRLCNHWERFVRNLEAQYGARWVLEIIPWSFTMRTLMHEEANGYLRTAECSYRINNETARYFDTEDSLRRKLMVAERYGCTAGIVLLREYRQIITKSAQFG